MVLNHQRLRILAIRCVIPIGSMGPLVYAVESNPNGPVVEGRNTAFGTGVEGYVGSVGGYGVLGIAANSSATAPASIGVVGTTTGPSGFPRVHRIARPHTRAGFVPRRPAVPRAPRIPH